MSEVDPNDETIDRWVVIAHRYDDETNHFRYMPVAAFTTRREYNQRFKLEAAKLEKRRSQGEAHYKESITGQWEGEGDPPVAFWIRAIRKIVSKLGRKKYSFTDNRGYAEYQAFLKGEELEDESDLD